MFSAFRDCSGVFLTRSWNSPLANFCFFFSDFYVITQCWTYLLCLLIRILFSSESRVPPPHPLLTGSFRAWVMNLPLWMLRKGNWWMRQWIFNMAALSWKCQILFLAKVNVIIKYYKYSNTTWVSKKACLYFPLWRLPQFLESWLLRTLYSHNMFRFH